MPLWRDQADPIDRMARRGLRVARKPTITRAALRLHHARPMRAFVCAAVLLLGAGARAQTATTTQTCSGMLSPDAIGLAYPDPTGSSNLKSVAAAWVPFAFNKAECDCATGDLVMQIQVKTALPQGTAANNQLWVGLGCDNYTTRTSPTVTQCEQIPTSELTTSTFNIGSPSVASGLTNIHIPALSLTSPRTHKCDQPSATNNAYVFVITTDPSMPVATCSLNLTEQLQGPLAAKSVTASGGDGRVTVGWQSDATSAPPQYSFQVLCSDACGNPVPGKSGDLGYSICVNNVISRRKLPQSSTVSTTPSTDGGTTGVNDPLGTEASPLDGGVGGTPDGGAVVCNLPDGGIGDPLASLDPKFLCTSPTVVSGTGSYNQAVGGLNNGQTYYFKVVAIDQFGNPTGSATVSGMPTPAEDLYSRYYHAGGRAQGFCFIATAAFGSYEHRYVKVLRDFRDRVLEPTESGRAFVSWYYDKSPPAAAFIARHPAARIGTQMLLWPVIGLAALWLYTSVWLKLALAGAVGGAWLKLRRRRRAA